MRVYAYSGWRHWTDTSFAIAELEHHVANVLLFGAANEEIVIRVGDEKKGFDQVVREFFATIPWAHVAVYEADWARFGGAAGPIRNRKMLLGEKADDPSTGMNAAELYAYPEPGVRRRKGSGTWDCIEAAVELAIRQTCPPYRPSESVLRERAGLLAHLGEVQ